MISATPGASVPDARIRAAAISTIRSWFAFFSSCEWPTVWMILIILIRWMTVVIQFEGARHADPGFRRTRHRRQPRHRQGRRRGAPRARRGEGLRTVRDPATVTD